MTRTNRTTTPRRGEILRTVLSQAEVRRDGRLPMDLDGVEETFGDELTLLGALLLRWHTRLSGTIERELMTQPLDLESAVVGAWQACAASTPGVLAIIDRHRAEPLDEQMAQALRVAAAKEHEMLAVLSGRAAHGDPQAARVGEQIAERARAAHEPGRRPAAA